eukprot:CAMPEP_0114269148 /NCGR_PEP_ID=MMETSP0058-20121206/26418_1 /TAXON_ID=36894 /ORGANISM="Pyramimonas parkeae, CCMP726" /LENGTH=140 /DNA_ID=CAMNT_0001387535 /DNA_START=315 /DNA_END=737 /DNA_ORIENTATION=-
MTAVECMQLRLRRMWWVCGFCDHTTQSNLLERTPILGITNREIANGIHDVFVSDEVRFQDLRGDARTVQQISPPVLLKDGIGCDDRIESSKEGQETDKANRKGALMKLRSGKKLEITDAELNGMMRHVSSLSSRTDRRAA